MTGYDGVLAVGLHRFAVRCAQRRQRLTTLAASNIVAMAKVIGVHAEQSLSELGFGGDLACSEDGLWEAMRVVEASGKLALLNQLDTLLMDLTVADVEGYVEPDEAQQACGG